MQSAYINPAYLAPHYSTKLWRVIYHYCARFYSVDLFNEICNELNIPTTYLLNDDNWVSDTFGRKFFDRLKEATGDDEIFRKIGTFFLDRQNINGFEHALLTSVTPYIFFKLVPLNYGKVNQVNSIRTVKKSPGHFIFEVKPKDRPAHPDVCKNTVGVWEAARELYGLDRIDISHDHCIHKGAATCEFQVRYSATGFWRKRAVKSLGYVVLALGPIFLVKTLFADLLNAAGTALVVSLAVVTTGLIHFRSRFLSLVRYNQIHYEQMRQKNQSVYESKSKLDRRYRESKLLRELSTSLIQMQNSSDVIKTCLEGLAKDFGYERAMVMLLSSDNKRLYTADVRGFDGRTEDIYKLSFQYPGKPGSEKLFAQILAKGDVAFIRDIEAYKPTLKAENKTLLEEFRVSSLIVCPIQDDKQKYGLVIVGTLGVDAKLSDEDLFLLKEVTKLLSLFFRNARNFEKEMVLRSTFQKYVPVRVLESIDGLSGDTSTMAPRLEHVTSLFVDLRGFTAIGETHSPERVVDMLNLYVEYITRHIAAFGGIVDNLVGDGIVAFFIDDKVGKITHADRGILASCSILADLDLLTKSYVNKGYPEPALGIGLNSGPATVGSLGCDRKMNYTAIGDTINLAARLQDLSKRYRGLTPSATKGCLIVSKNSLALTTIFKETNKVQPLSLGEVEIRGRKQKEIVHFYDQEIAKRLVDENLDQSEIDQLISSVGAALKVA